MRGLFITFEGGEGSGKSTQSRLLLDRLKSDGQDAVLTREPGGTEGAEAIRSLLVTGDPERWDRRTELLLLMAARRDHVARLIRPALDRGTTVVCDRFIDSTLAYQGYGKGEDLTTVAGLHDLATDGLHPDITFYLRIDPGTGLRRSDRGGGSESRFEAHDARFHARVRAGFEALAAGEPERFVVIDSSRSAEEVAAHIWRSLQSLRSAS